MKSYIALLLVLLLAGCESIPIAPFCNKEFDENKASIHQNVIGVFREEQKEYPGIYEMYFGDGEPDTSDPSSTGREWHYLYLPVESGKYLDADIYVYVNKCTLDAEIYYPEW